MSTRETPDFTRTLICGVASRQGKFVRRLRQQHIQVSAKEILRPCGSECHYQRQQDRDFSMPVDEYVLLVTL